MVNCAYVTLSLVAPLVTPNNHFVGDVNDTVAIRWDFLGLVSSHPAECNTFTMR